MSERIQVNGGTFGNSASARTVAFPANVTAGNLIVVAVATFNIVTLTITDSLGNTYTQAGTYSAAGSNRVSLWYAFNITSGACTVTVTPSATAFMTIGILERSGTGTTDPIHSSAQNTGTSATFTGGSLTVTDPTELAVAVFTSSSALSLLGVISAPLGMTVYSGLTTNSPFVFADGIATATLNPTFTNAASVAFAAAGATFKITQAAGGGLLKVGGMHAGMQRS